MVLSAKDMGLQNILESQLGQVEQDVKQQLWQLMQLVALHNQLNQKLSSFRLNGGKTKQLGNGGKVVLYRNNVSCAFLSKSCVHSKLSKMCVSFLAREIRSGWHGSGSVFSCRKMWRAHWPKNRNFCPPGQDLSKKGMFPL